jgi:cellulose synthase/poly-beta-1,6-N-acetylglucosamine synthase-like glycosyltransferase
MISVIVPAYNAAQTLDACLAALGAQTVGADAYEVIVVDDGSTDRTAAVARAHGVCLIQQANAGPAAARNRGAQAARGEILLFTDADCAPAPDWVERMAAPFADPAVMGAKGVYRTRQRSPVARMVQVEYESRYARMAGRQQIDFVDTYAAAYRRGVFVESGGFDTVYRTASVEDQELSFRLAGRGHRLVYVPQAIVYHCHDETVGQYWRRKYGIGYWKALLLRAHPQRAVRDSHTPQALKAQIGLLGAACACVLLAPWLAWARWGALVVLALALSAASPLLVRAARRDLALLPVACLLVLVRALALGTGLVAGAVRFWLRRPVRVGNSDGKTAL